MVAFPSLGSEADEVSLPGPCTTAARGGDAVAAYQPAARIQEVLENLDKKRDGGENLGVGPDEVGGGGAIDDGVCASLVDEQVAQRDGARTRYCARASRVLAEVA